ncbi:hypothetical protein DY000_02018342 [Brassica cretica]|uniref:Zinc finger GRF-type domain-containing protein n=1 Tax=Brassica cretica TaxID=69181 RepID=A0ABQ7CWH5_BRACR|nr:hypothetical protein DY000_02018342 [Brassica cretica]
MGQDYSYSQSSSSSDSLDITSLLEAGAQIYVDEADISYCNALPVQYPPQPEADDGIPTTCYCGAQPVLGCSYTPKDPYRRYFTCHNADDGDCHVWKWWDVAVMEEMMEFQRQVRDLKVQGNEKLLNLEKTLHELSKEKSGVKLMVCLLVLIGIVAKGSKESGIRREFLLIEKKGEEGEPEGRPPGVKAAKAGCKKKKSVREEELTKLQGVLEMKEKLSRHKLLDRLLAKTEPLSDMETSLKLKLMSEML